MKIKTLRDILEPKAIKLGISFEEVLEATNDDKRFGYVISQLEKIKDRRNIGFFTKVLESFMQLDKFTEFCQTNFYLTPSKEMYSIYNKNICVGIIENKFKELKRGWQRPTDHSVFPIRNMVDKTPMGDWIEEVKKYKSIDEIKEYVQEEIKSGRDEDIAKLWESNIISRFIQFHARNLLWDKIDELKIKDTIPTRPPNEPGAEKKWKRDGAEIDSAWLKARDYSKSKGYWRHGWGGPDYDENMCKFEIKYLDLCGLSQMLDYLILEKPDILKLQTDRANVDMDSKQGGNGFCFNGLEKVTDDKWYYSKNIRKHYSEKKFNTLQNRVRKQLKKVDKIIAK